VRQPSDTVPADTVISQNPTDGTEVSPNSSVRLFVSSGPSAVTVPDLKGLTVQEAQNQLSDQGLSVGTVTEVDDPDTEAGKIIDSNPGTGASVSPDTKINVRIGTGKVAVPNVVGKSQSEAQTIIAAANLQVETRFRATNDVPEGTVISQRPKDGTIDIGGTVRIVVAQKAAPTLTPTTVTPTPTVPSASTSPTPPPTP
jgi:eukaryotic-like serine/threonine-protein kinase